MGCGINPHPALDAPRNQRCKVYGEHVITRKPARRTSDAYGQLKTKREGHCKIKDVRSSKEPRGYG